MYFAFILTIIMILLSGVLIYFDKEAVGFLTLFTVIAGHAYNYRNQRKKEEKHSKSEKKD